MKFVGLSTACSLGAMSAIALISSPSQAQHVSIPVSNGSFAITRVGGNLQYTTMPTFLSPAGTIIITGADPKFVWFQFANPITTNTPVGVVGSSLVGSVNLRDSRTATFTDARFSLRGTATVSGVASITPIAPIGFSPSLIIPNGATLSYTAQSGAIHIPETSLSAYSVPQFTIPISGGSFTLTGPTGTGNATVTLNSVVTPLGTATLTLDAPYLRDALGLLPPFLMVGSVLTSELSGLTNGTVALSDGRVATVTDRLVSFKVNAQVLTLSPAGGYIQGVSLLTTPAILQGAITGGSISVPTSAVTPLPAPVQPPAVVEQKVISVAPPKPQELALGFAKNVTLREPYEFIDVKVFDKQGKNNRSIAMTYQK